MDKKIHIQELIQARNLASQAECAKFENALSALWGKLEADDLDDVLKAFSDETADDELMFSLVHLVEQNDGDEYLRKIALLTPEMDGAREWAKMLNRRILNSGPHSERYRKIIGTLGDSQKEKITALLDALA